MLIGKSTCGEKNSSIWGPSEPPATSPHPVGDGGQLKEGYLHWPRHLTFFLVFSLPRQIWKGQACSTHTSDDLTPLLTPSANSWPNPSSLARSVQE